MRCGEYLRPATRSPQSVPEASNLFPTNYDNTFSSIPQVISASD